jgi:methylenetetrahydrofolate dehydrogenase (NADP+)/methenyltetrahydrofolate cyclohydrolase
MAKLLDGKSVASALKVKQQAGVAELALKGVTPTLSIIRIGEREDDIAYERSAIRRCETAGVAVRQFILPQETTQNALLERIDRINRDVSIHGALLLRPLPSHLHDDVIRNALNPLKDVDGITDVSMVGVFTGSGRGFSPCTAQACIEILDHFGVALKGKRVTVVGRSLVVGKPVSIMLMGRHATVTVCHTRTVDMPVVCRDAEILIVAAGHAKMACGGFFSPGQVVIDVGINIEADGNICGDVDFEAAEPVVDAITPVPGGVGIVTTAVLVDHIIAAANELTLRNEMSGVIGAKNQVD